MGSPIWYICDDNFLSFRTKNNKETYHSKIFYFFNNRPKIAFLRQQNIHFSGSHYVSVYADYWLFYDKKGA